MMMFGRSVTGPGAICCRIVGLSHLEPHEVERLPGHLVAGGLEDFDRVVDRLVIAGRARHPGPIVVVGDLLQGGLVLANAFDGHAVKKLLEGVVRPTSHGAVDTGGPPGLPETAAGQDSVASSTKLAAKATRRILEFIEAFLPCVPRRSPR